MNLRQYQKEAVDSYFRSKYDRNLICIATGGGKTVVAKAIINKLLLDNRKKILFIAHRDELIRQPFNRFKDLGFKIGIEKSTETSVGDEDIILGSVQSLNIDRLQKFNPEHFQLVIIDEAHHATAMSYTNVLKYFKDTKVLGLTATPNRADGKGLYNIFDSICYTKWIDELIEEEWLSKFKSYRVVGEDVDKTKVVQKAYKDLCMGEQTVIFCSDINNALEIEHAIRALGVVCESVHHYLDTPYRQLVLDRFRNKTIECIVNVEVLTEGYDNPDINNVIIARSTSSPVLYNQMIGRALRLSDAEYAKIIDVDLNYKSNSIISVASLFGFHSNFDFEGKDPREVKRKIRAIQIANPNIRINKFDCLSDIERVSIEEIDIFKSQNNNIGHFDIPKDLSGMTSFVWTKHLDKYIIYLGDVHISSGDRRAYIEVFQDLLDNFTAIYIEKSGETIAHQEHIFSSKTLSECIKTVDEHIKKNITSTNIVDANASWRRQPATFRQKKELRKHDIAFPNDMTRGQANVLLSKLYLAKANE